MEIRALTPQDANAFRGLRLEALENDPHAFGESAREHQAIPFEIHSSRLASGSSGNFVLGAFANGQLIGMVGFLRDQRDKTAHKGRVWGVYVKPEWRAQEIGRALLSALVERAQTQSGLEQVVLTVASEQTVAKRLYSSLGFEVFGHERHALKMGEIYVDEDHMVLWMAPRPPGGD